MKINYDKNVGVAIIFSMVEIKVALAVLKGLYKFFKMDFIQEAITDIEGDMFRKVLPMINYHHICTRCCMVMDERDQNVMHYKNGSIDSWHHKLCPELKPNRPV